jgi:hypothetical protein
MLKLLGGGVSLLLGTGLAGWLFFNLFIHRVAEFQGRPYSAMMFCVALFYVGQMWVRDGWASLSSASPRTKKSAGAAKAKVKPRPLESLDE